MATEYRSSGTDVRLDRLLERAANVGYDLLVYGTILFLLAPLAVVVIISFQSNAYAGWPPSPSSATTSSTR